MGQRAVLGLLFAISGVVWGSTPQGNSHTRPQPDSSGGAGQVVGTWRLISRVVTLEDGTVVQDPGLGKTPSGSLIVARRAPPQVTTASRSTDMTHTLVRTP